MIKGQNKGLRWKFWNIKGQNKNNPKFEKHKECFSLEIWDFLV